MPKSTETKTGKSKKTEEEDSDVEEKTVSKPAVPKPMKKKRDPKPADSEPEPKESAPEPSPEPVAKKAKKAKKPEPESEPEPEPEPEPESEPEEEEEGEEDEEVATRRKLSQTKKRKKAKLVGYRSLARSVGYIDRLKSDSSTTAGIDGIASLLSSSDAKRLMRFVPATPSATSFGLNEFQKRHDLFKHGVSAPTARETQARCDVAMRSIMNQVVLRAADTGKKNITASMMASILRPYADNMLFTAVVPPVGLVRYAQGEGILSSTESDKKMMEAEKKENNSTKKIAAEWEASETARLEAARASRAAKPSA